MKLGIAITWFYEPFELLALNLLTFRFYFQFLFNVFAE